MGCKTLTAFAVLSATALAFAAPTTYEAEDLAGALPSMSKRLPSTTSPRKYSSSNSTGLPLKLR